MHSRLLAALAVALTAASCGSPGTAASDPPPGATFGISVNVPDGWSTVWGPCPDCADPRGIFDLASYTFPDGGLDLCQEIPPGQAAIALSERVAEAAKSIPSSVYPPRPARFNVTSLDVGQVSEGCEQPRTRLFRFRDAGRLMYAWVVVGPETPTSVLEQAEDVLNSIRVETPA
jgi:hypothetical protein